MLARVQGFRLYVATAEADQIAFQEREEIFSRYLPYAMVFGLVVRLAEQHDPALRECREHVISAFVAAWIDPCTYRHVAGGMRCTDTERSDWAR